LLYVFEDYTLDTERRELRHGTVLVAVEPQVFDLLEYLIRNRERVVSREDLVASIWGRRVVSESALSTRINAARSAIGDNGREQRLIKTLARRGFRFVGSVPNEGGTAAMYAGQLESPAPARADNLSDRPSIAVLPFTNLSGDPEQEYFADGIVEEIITALSRIRWLFVIARNSSFTYKGRAIDLKQVGRELGVRYVLEGSVRKALNRVRIAGQLIDTSTGAHLWADRFEGNLEHIFDLQDQVAANVVGAVAPKLELAEIERAKRKPTDSLDAYDYFLRGMASFHQSTRASIGKALPLFQRAIDYDPDYAAAFGMAAWCYVRRKASRWVAEPAQEISETERLARRALDLGKEDALALCTAGHALGYVVGELEQGASFIDQALALNPNLATALSLSGWMRLWLGELDTSIELQERAMRLSPRDSQLFIMECATALGHLCSGRYNEASAWAVRAFSNHPNYVASIAASAASYAHLGRPQDARKALARTRELDPTLRISGLKNWTPFRQPDHLKRWMDGLRKAGLPG
jgi:TolB-like protein